jgi:hypothetical protein
MRLNHHCCCVSMVLVGLFVVCAVASEATPSEGESVTVSLRRLSTGEVVSIFDEISEMVPGGPTNTKDRAGLASLVPLSEVTAAPLEDALPGVRFYKGLDFGITPSIPYLMAIAEGKRYLMPGRFNLLLLDNGLEVNDKNILEMARAFVMLTVGTQSAADAATGGSEKAELLSFPQISFLDATRKDLATGRPTDAATLKVEIGAQTEEWYFSVLRNQFDFVSRGGEKGLIKNYLPVMVESLPDRR